MWPFVQGSYFILYFIIIILLANLWLYLLSENGYNYNTTNLILNHVAKGSARYYHQQQSSLQMCLSWMNFHNWLVVTFPTTNISPIRVKKQMQMCISCASRKQWFMLLIVLQFLISERVFIYPKLQIYIYFFAIALATSHIVPVNFIVRWFYF